MDCVSDAHIVTSKRRFMSVAEEHGVQTDSELGCSPWIFYTGNPPCSIAKENITDISVTVPY